MQEQEIYSALNEIFRDVLDEESITLLPDTTADDIEDWNSLSHIQLVSEIEKHFYIRFSSREIMMWRNVGEMVQTILSRV